LGALAGGIGWFIDLGGETAGLQRAAAWLAGVGMIVYAIGRLTGVGQRWIGSAFSGFVASPLSRWLSRAQRVKGWKRAAIIGVASSLMPCGWLYAFVLAAAGTGRPLTGAALMTAFWLGTVPILGLIVVGAGRVTPAIAARVPGVLAVAVLSIGVYTIGMRGSIDLSSMPALGAKDPMAIRQLDHGDLPCCAGGHREE
jgi:sulfite exporter TauE/SafE